MAQDDGHRYFFGQMPHAPWKNGDYIMDKQIELLRRFLLIAQLDRYEEIKMYYIDRLIETNQDIVEETIGDIPYNTYVDLDEIATKIK